MKPLDTFVIIDIVGRTGSIRQAAEQLGVSPSSLTRKIQAFEQDLGSPVFERLPHGMRLNEAGTLLVQFIRRGAAELEQLRGTIAELAGGQTGRIRIACSQAFVDRVLPEAMSRFRATAPGIRFDVTVRDHALGVAALTTFEADLALLVSAEPVPEMQVLLSGRQPLCAIMHRDHPAASGTGPIRLGECLRHPIAMPAANLAVRSLLEQACSHTQHAIDVRVESDSIDLLRNYVLWERLLSFQLATGLPLGIADLLAVPVDTRDVPLISVVLGQLRSRTLTRVVVRFVEQFAEHPMWNKPDDTPDLPG